MEMFIPFGQVIFENIIKGHKLRLNDSPFGKGGQGGFDAFI